MNSSNRYVDAKERGRGLHKRRWGIEMNEARRLYLGTYGMIDKIDHYITNCNMNYRQVQHRLMLSPKFFSYYYCPLLLLLRSWKYWHSPMNYAKALAVTVAYDVYRECAEGKI